MHKQFHKKSQRRRATGLAVASAALAACTLAAATPSLAANPDITAHGGAQRSTSSHVEDIKKSIVDGPAKNVILLIGDGMGDSEITAARNYARGAAGRFPGIDALPLTGQYTTYSLNKATGGPDYAPDSAATGTAWATGTKSYNGAISVDVKGNAQKSILQIAKANGLKTGNVSTAELQDATPAVQVASVSSRSCYGPVATAKSCPENALENGGKGSITEQMLDTRPDVSLGGGSATFAETAKAGAWVGKTLTEQATARGYKMVSTASELAAVTAANADAPVLGLFAKGNLPVRWEGALATHAGGAEAPIKCTDNPARTAAQPSLSTMTGKAIELLKDSSKGFFLQVEGASIDKQDHAANPCGQIGETVDLDEAVTTALDFAKADGNTMVVVTADHAHSSQIIYPGSNTPGLTRSLTTVDGETMTMAYGTAEEGGSQAHTGSQLRIAAFGPGAANVVGLSDQTDLFFTMSNTLALDPAAVLPTASPSAPATTAPGSETTSAAPSAPENTSASAVAAAPAGGGNGPLALTGTTVAGWVLAAMALLTAGFMVRRRARAAHSA
ncbi:alkaline phosphatase [Arthrobacter sp. GMC3]|uniref:alkaline phosphatase n=1 Tax=Arthrobacter sp. GMC3 TaxID=2058894 RepID=UPI0021587355|nr:alkaline phosphatase [Arthrobacter sp. GMC3]